ncbi:hypothetical protein [Robertmurraya kyonggiensis]|uniref:Uncharacterized protein n=1 Tax=Robertmurraya kyonggiensis TaxID=1037680 RepID=A0A4V5P118_9BACI|nr:hypothetical protein [Robertmurraya kyonggiensis]TKC15040.1 hypothetical protein FA727_19280 [Robertmurraya kyonggiensis]
MNTQKEVNETRITLREHEAIVENINTGIPMNRRAITPSDLALSMLVILEDEAVVQYLLREKNFDDMFENFFNVQHINGESMIEEMKTILGMALDYIQKAEDDEAVTEFFLTLVSKFDPTEFSEEETIKALRRFLSRIYTFEDRSHIQELFTHLLEEINLLGTEMVGQFAGKIMEQLLKSVKKNTLDIEMIHSLFKATSLVAERDWVLEVLERHIPKKKVCSSPLLPKNCFIYQEMMDGALIVGIEVDSQRFDIHYHRKQFEDVGHPKMLFLFTVRGQKVLGCQLVCVKDQVLTPDTQLYRYPFSNVFEDTRTCWPDLNSYQIKTVAHLGTMPFAFLHSQNNDHAFRGTNLGEMYQGLQGQDFDNETLVKLDMTFEEWLGVLKKTLV